MTEGEGPPAPLPQGERRQGERRREERKRVRLFEQLIAAEQDERRRLALFLHDGAVQSLSGIALMLDAVGHAIEDGRPEDAKQILDGALSRQRQTIQSLRDLSFDLEPIVLRDQGFLPAVKALADRLGIDESVKVEVEVTVGRGVRRAGTGRSLPADPRGVDAGDRPPSDHDRSHAAGQRATAAPSYGSGTTGISSGDAGAPRPSRSAPGR